jgi:two-component system OmpR family response regulator
MENTRNRALFARSVVTPRVLVVDGDPDTLGALRGTLTQSGFEVETAGSGLQAAAMLHDGLFDVIVMDPNLPDWPPARLLDQTFQAYPDVLLFILASEATMESAVTAARFHATEYMLKDPSPERTAEEVSAALARCARLLQERAVLRILGEALGALQTAGSAHPLAPAPAAPYVLHAPPLCLNRRERVVLVGDDFEQAQRLTPGEVEVLSALMARAGQVLTVEELGEAVAGAPVEEASVRSAVAHVIHRLRRKLETDPDHPHLIRTIRGVGYMVQTNINQRGGERQEPRVRLPARAHN